MNINEEELFIEIDGKMYCDKEAALAILLYDEILFANGREYLHPNGKNAGSTTVLFVICNDLFAWATSDAEKLPCKEIENLYKMYKKDKKWGASKWCCIQRNTQPQKPIIDEMKKDGVWDKIMEALPKNIYGE